MTKQFKVPTQEEVAEYMHEKKGWPPAFCTYYAEKFWSHYQSNGWKVSGRAAMKDWKAAFNSQWQSPKFQVDTEKLRVCMEAYKKTTPETGPKLDPYQRLDQLMMLYKSNPGAIEEDRYCKMHDWLKERKLLEITPEQEQIIADLCKRYEAAVALCRGKAMRVKFLFSNMIGYNKRFSPNPQT